MMLLFVGPGISIMSYSSGFLHPSLILVFLRVEFQNDPRAYLENGLLSVTEIFHELGRMSQRKWSLRK